jgi:type VI secretion system Hcp family effector
MNEIRSWPRLAAAAGAGAVVAAAVIVLVGGVPLPSAQAAPVPATQASCPAPVDPRAITRSTKAYARVEGIPGDSTASGHVNEIDVTDLRVVMLASNTVLCGGTGQRSTWNPIVIDKGVDRASVPLAQAATSRRLAFVRISVVGSFNGHSATFLTLDLSSVAVSSIRLVQRSGDSLTEEVEFDFTKITYTYVQVKSDGTPGTTTIFCFDRFNQTSC